MQHEDLLAHFVRLPLQFELFLLHVSQLVGLSPEQGVYFVWVVSRFVKRLRLVAVDLLQVFDLLRQLGILTLQLRLLLLQTIDLLLGRHGHQRAANVGEFAPVRKLQLPDLLVFRQDQESETFDDLVALEDVLRWPRLQSLRLLLLRA